MIDEECKVNREVFAESQEARKLDFLPNKYVNKYIEEDRENIYDHPMMYRNDKYDYLFISNYGKHFNVQLMAEGFETVPPMYNTSCRSFMKIFKNTKTSKVAELSGNRYKMDMEAGLEEQL